VVVVEPPPEPAIELVVVDAPGAEVLVAVPAVVDEPTGPVPVGASDVEVLVVVVVDGCSTVEEVGSVVVVVTTLTGTVILVGAGSVRTWRYHHPSPKKATTMMTVDQRIAMRPPIG